ncbi:MAG TPA: PAS domain-containing sensor histidine kinase [Ktedonobacterales bacterium]|nr:PAS domain-containing sensor histidine kinase [Ktedonobacterales bacterium]
MNSRGNEASDSKEAPAPIDFSRTSAARASSAAITTTSLATLTRLLDLSPDAVVVIDERGIIILANPQASALFGYTPDQLIDHPLELLLPERLRAGHIRHRTGYLAAPHSRPMGVGLELEGRRKDGVEFPVDISLRPCLIKGQLHVMAAIRDVSAQRQWERERANLLARLRLQTDLINLAHDAILVRDPANRILVWNKGAEALYGWTAQEALGRVMHTLFKTRFPISRTTIEAQLQRDGAWEGELAHTRPDGRIVIVESRQVLVRDAAGQPSAVLEINRDITERRQMEEAEATAQANTLVQLSFLQQLIDALPNGIYVVHGQDARLMLANRAATSTWGAIWEPEQPMEAFLEQHGIKLTDAQGQLLTPDVWATLRALRYGETSLQLQEVINRPHGDALPILVNAVPLAFSYWQSLEVGLSPLDDSPGHDFSLGDHAEERSAGEPLALVIQQDVRVLKEAEYVKDEFIGLAAHELRTPVAALKGAIGTLLFQTQQGHGPALADWQQEMLDEIDIATNRLTDLTDELLDVTRLQAGQLLLHPAPTDLVTLVRRVVSRIQTTTTHHQLDVSIGAARGRGTRIPNATMIANVDAARIEQVLTNLVTNAIKYSPAGGSIHITLARRNGPGGADDKQVEIRVRDHGVGIPEHQHSLIFGRFMRADNARRAGISGTGLGLYISRGLVEQHGGQIWFESKEDNGATFFVLLPLHAHQEPGANLDE